jgi:hypothetical protein
MKRNAADGLFTKPLNFSFLTYHTFVWYYQSKEKTAYIPFCKRGVSNLSDNSIPKLGAVLFASLQGQQKLLPLDGGGWG